MLIARLLGWLCWLPTTNYVNLLLKILNFCFSNKLHMKMESDFRVLYLLFMFWGQKGKSKMLEVLAKCVVPSLSWLTCITCCRAFFCLEIQPHIWVSLHDSAAILVCFIWSEFIECKQLLFRHRGSNIEVPVLAKFNLCGVFFIQNFIFKYF